MKSITSIVLAFAATAVWAAPQSGQNNLNELALTISTDASESGLNGQDVELNGGFLGFWAGATGEPVRVYTIDGTQQGTVSLHTLPIGIVDHALILRNGPGLYDLVDDIPPQDSSDENIWDTFVLTDDGRVTLDGTSQEGSTAGWLAFPAGDGNWSITWSDGTGFIIQNYVAVDIHYTARS